MTDGTTVALNASPDTIYNTEKYKRPSEMIGENPSRLEFLCCFFFPHRRDRLRLGVLM